MGSVIYLTISIASIVAVVALARVFVGRKLAYQEVRVRVKR